MTFALLAGLFLMAPFPVVAGDISHDLEQLAMGRKPAATFSLQFWEEQPQRLSLSIVISGNGQWRAERSTLLPSCPEYWNAHCWDKSMANGTWDKTKMQHLFKNLTALEYAAQGGPPMPGSEYATLTLTIDNNVVEHMQTLSLIGTDIDFGLLRDEFHKLLPEIEKSGDKVK